MRVFVLCTGRCGSVTFIKACQHIENFSAGHESLCTRLDESRFDYPDNHIEADNRLSWFLGDLGKRFDDDTFFVHLKRNKQATVKSYNERWFINSLSRAFALGIALIPIDKFGEEERLKACEFCYDTVNNNISYFLQNKKNTLVVELENIREDFPYFWTQINAKGNLELALREFDIRYNATKIP